MTGRAPVPSQLLSANWLPGRSGDRRNPDGCNEVSPPKRKSKLPVLIVVLTAQYWRTSTPRVKTPALGVYEKSTSFALDQVIFRQTNNNERVNWRALAFRQGHAQICIRTALPTSTGTKSLRSDEVDHQSNPSPRMRQSKLEA
jgi:hypothetical protein